MTAPSGGPIRVLIADDTVVVRGLLRRVLEGEPDIEVVGTAENGRVAVAALKAKAADVVLLDIEMPGMDGLEALPLLLRERPEVRIIMVSTLTQRGARATLEALSRGAADYATKPSTLRNGASLDALRGELLAKIRALGRHRPSAVGTGSAPPAGGALRSRMVPPRVMAIGASTGGPQALSAVLGGLPAELRMPILVAQHMPPTFTSMLAEHLGKDSGRPSHHAADGLSVKDGEIYVAPGDYHMTVEARPGRAVIRLNQAPPENFCRPAVDPLFRSVAAVYGPAALAVVLTGMGEDGRRGSEAIVRAGGTVIAQDEATSVVWGMPGAVVRDGLAAAVLPLKEIAMEIARFGKLG